MAYSNEWRGAYVARLQNETGSIGPHRPAPRAALTPIPKPRKRPLSSTLTSAAPWLSACTIGLVKTTAVILVIAIGETILFLRNPSTKW